MRSFLFPAFALSLAIGFNACDFLPGSGTPIESGNASAPASPGVADIDQADSGPQGANLFTDDADAGPALAKLSGYPLLWRSDFEDQSAACWGARNASGYATAACGEFGGIGAWGSKLTGSGGSRSGFKSLGMTYAKNEDVAGASLTLSANVVNVRAYYMFGAGYDFGQGVKIGRVQSFNSSTQMNDIDVVLQVRSKSGVNQCGLTDMGDLGIYFNGRPAGFDWGSATTARAFQRNRWYAIEYQVFLNTPGQRDGWVKIWVDGVEAVSKTGLRLRGNGGANVKLNRIRLGGWYSNSAHGNSCANPSQPSTMYVDDVAVSTQYIGLD